MRTRSAPLLTSALTLVVGTVAALLVSIPPSPASADHDAERGHLVATVAAPHTPHVLNGRVYSVVQVGRTIVLGGTFSRARDDGRAHVFVRHGLLAFDAVTGRIDEQFAPEPRGGVRVVLPAADGRSIYVGGGYTSVAGTRQAKLARLRLSDGTMMATFDPGRVTGAVKDLALTGGRLWVAGAFTSIDGVPQTALATLDPRTGTPTRFMSLTLSGHHTRGVTQVLKIAAAPNGSRQVAIGNFDRLAGVRNHQLLVLGLTGRRASPGAWRTSFYTSACSKAFDSTMRDVDISPDNSYVVVATTGAYGGPSGSCDTVARFELRGAGRDVVPSWVDYSGGDTTFAVEATGSAVYVGGHGRWWNNPYAGNRAGAGAVAREGIAALDPLNGLPLTWNPGRDRGVGVFDFLLTQGGLWVASDTSRIGADQVKGRIARFPATGEALPAVRAPRLPGTVFLGGATAGSADAPADETSGLRRRVFDGRSAGRAGEAPGGDIDWSLVRGAFMVNGELYIAHANGRLTTRSFDGTTYGKPRAVATADQVVPLTSWRTDIRHATGMFFERGRIYFTLEGSHTLFYRYFSPQSQVVGAKRLVSSPSFRGLDFAHVRGMFGTATTLYWATRDGQLHSVGWRHGGPSGLPTRKLGPTWPAGASGGGDWAAHALFVYVGSG